jgi:hypothetical protein
MSLDIPTPQDMVKTVRNRIVADLSSWTMRNMEYLCNSVATRGFIHLSELKFEKILLEEAGWNCTEKKAPDNRRWNYELVVSGKSQSFSEMTRAGPLSDIESKSFEGSKCITVTSPFVVWQAWRQNVEQKVQEKMENPIVQNELCIYGNNVTFDCDHEREAGIVRDFLEASGWTIILDEKFVIVCSPLYKYYF